MLASGTHIGGNCRRGRDLRLLRCGGSGHQRGLRRMTPLSLEQREIIANNRYLAALHEFIAALTIGDARDIDLARDKVMDSHSVALDLLSERVQNEAPDR